MNGDIFLPSHGSRAVDNGSQRVGEDEDDGNAGRLAHFSSGQVNTEYKYMTEREVPILVAILPGQHDS